MCQKLVSHGAASITLASFRCADGRDFNENPGVMVSGDSVKQLPLDRHTLVKPWSNRSCFEVVNHQRNMFDTAFGFRVRTAENIDRPIKEQDVLTLSGIGLRILAITRRSIKCS